MNPAPKGRSFSKSRLEAFSDGVFAIAITLLVLDIAVKPGGTPLDAVFLRLNLLLLLFVVFLPFPTKLVTDAFGKSEAERVAVTVFGFTLLLIRLLSVALDQYAKAEGLYSTDGDDEELAQARSKSRSGLVLYVVAIVIGFLLPRVAVAIYFGTALYLAVPWRHVARLLSRRTSTSG